jgi:hypothetical protein
MGGKAERKHKKVSEEALLTKKGRTDDLTLTGSAMGIVGGGILIGSIPLAWVIFDQANTDVFSLIKGNGLYFVILIAQLLAFIQVSLSATMLRSAAWPIERKRIWSLPLLIIAVLIAALIAVGMVMLQLDYMGSGTLYTYGPAPILSIFGLAFGVTGAIMFFLDIKAKHPGDVRAPRPREPSFAETHHAKQVKYESACPGCGSGVSDDLAVCPHCGAVLTGSEDEVRDIDDLDEDDIETVR